MISILHRRRKQHQPVAPPLSHVRVIEPARRPYDQYGSVEAYQSHERERMSEMTLAEAVRIIAKAARR